MKSYWNKPILITFWLLVLALASALANHTTPAQTPDKQSTPPTLTQNKTLAPAANSNEAKENRKKAYLRYMEAQRLKTLRQTKLTELVAIYKEIIQLDPLAAEPHADLSEIYFYLRQPDAVEREAREAVRLDPNCLDGHKWLARLFIISVRLEKEANATQLARAISSYEEVVRIDPTNAEAWAFLADLYQMKNDTARQIKALEKLTAVGTPTDTGFYRNLMNTDIAIDQAWYQLSQLYLSQGNKSLALEAARRAFENDADSNVNARNLVNMLRLSRSSSEELQAYERLLKRFDSPVLQAGHGAALLRMARYPEAITKFRDLLKADPANTGIIELLAVAQRRSGKRLEAVETLKQAISNVEPGARHKLSLELGETYEEMGRLEDAVAHYEGVFNALANRPRLDAQNANLLTTVVSRLTRAYNRQGDKKKSQEALTRTQQILGESNPLVSSLLIDGLREEGKLREALEATRAALLRFNNDRSLRLTEALVLGDLRKYNDSLEALRQILKEQTIGDTTVLTIMSNVQMQSGQLKDAEATIRKALQEEPNDMELHIQLSSIQDRSGQGAEAEKTLRAVIQQEPDNATALNNLGYYLAERNARYQEALPLIEKAVSIEPLNSSFLDSLGWVQYKLGRLQEARGHLERAAQYARRNPTIYEHLGDVLRDLGRLQEARRNWEVALEYSVEDGVSARLKDKLKNTQ